MSTSNTRGVVEITTKYEANKIVENYIKAIFNKENNYKLEYDEIEINSNEIESNNSNVQNELVDIITTITNRIDRATLNM